MKRKTLPTSTSRTTYCLLTTPHSSWWVVVGCKRFSQFGEKISTNNFSYSCDTLQGTACDDFLINNKQFDLLLIKSGGVEKTHYLPIGNEQLLAQLFQLKSDLLKNVKLNILNYCSYRITRLAHNYDLTEPDLSSGQTEARPGPQPPQRGLPPPPRDRK